MQMAGDRIHHPADISQLPGDPALPDANVGLVASTMTTA
jgi:hypothetical protein